VDKVLVYEREPPAIGFARKLLMCGASLWGHFDQEGDHQENGFQEGWRSDAEVWSERLLRDSILPYWNPELTKIFDTTPEVLLTPEVIFDELEKGFGFVNMQTHGLENAWLTEVTDRYYNTDASCQTNLGRYPVVYTISCHTNALQNRSTSLAEALLLNPDGGAVAYIGSSKEGWGEPGSYEGGPSIIYNRTFFEKLLGDGVSILGEVFAEHKWALADECATYNKYRWLQFSLNLFGDPGMYVWTDDPRRLLADHPPRVVVGPQALAVRTEPFVRVCLWKPGKQGDEVYVHGMANAEGRFAATIQPATPGTLLLTITGPGYLPYQADLAVVVNTEGEGATGGEDAGWAEPDGSYDGSEGENPDIQGSCACGGGSSSAGWLLFLLAGCVLRFTMGGGRWRRRQEPHWR
jgi:hypothetical protein